MEQAACPDMVHQLLQETTDAGRNGWYVRCDELVKPSLFVNDVARAWQSATKRFEQNPLENLCLLWRYTLIRSSLNSMASNAPSELIEALVKKQVWQPAQGLAYAQQTQDPSKKASCIAALASYIPEGLLSEAEAVIAQINAPTHRLLALNKLATRGTGGDKANPR